MSRREEDLERLERLMDETSRSKIQSGRCEQCWHRQCACEALEPLPLRGSFTFTVVIHWREWWRPGGSKLLRAGDPERTSFLVYPRDEVRGEGQWVLLAPNDGIAVDDFAYDATAPLNIIVVEAPRGLARKVARRVAEAGPPRLQKVRAPDETSSLLSLGLFLCAVGEAPEVLDACRHYLKVNRLALEEGPPHRGRRYPLWTCGPNAGHPAWYYGDTSLRRAYEKQNHLLGEG